MDNHLVISEDNNPNENGNMDERKHFQRIVNAFKCYRLHSLRRLFSSLKCLKSLPTHHQALLMNYRQHLEKVQLAVEHNSEIVKLIIRDVAHMFENADHSDDVKAGGQPVTAVSSGDIDKVQSVFKQFVREWSQAGAEERKASFQPILNEIQERFPPQECNPRDVQILVPGAGLGRLTFEIASQGYSCQGNEFSLFMLFASNFILNRCKGVDLYRVYPWVHQYYNHLNASDQLQMATFPDVDPSNMPLSGDFSMAAGNFTEIYTEPDSWDCVATCFFLDTASNVVSYIETIWNILKPGGFWINLGPLLYHYADLPNEDSIEPSYDQIREIIIAFGFQLLKEESGVRTPYTQNPCSMMAYEYRSVFFVCRKGFH